MKKSPPPPPIAPLGDQQGIEQTKGRRYLGMAAAIGIKLLMYGGVTGLALLGYKIDTMAKNKVEFDKVLQNQMLANQSTIISNQCVLFYQYQRQEQSMAALTVNVDAISDQLGYVMDGQDILATNLTKASKGINAILVATPR